jgi:peptidoglycan/xylan/chitin deacetylase (PgdA/CDA1 family)
VSVGAKKALKLAALQLCGGLGLIQLASKSSWRSRRLLILAYHGIALDDEHRWNPELFISAGEFESRLEHLRRNEYRVWPLSSGLKHLYDGTLPEKSVVITVDDGNYDFYAKGFPLLQRYGFPATVYLTTYYCDYNKPLFNHICSYMLWKKAGSVMPAAQLVNGVTHLDLQTTKSRHHLLQKFVRIAEEQQWSAEEKNEFARKLAETLGLDYGKYLEIRLLHRMNAAEVREVAKAGIDIQLHTHRHRTPDDRWLFAKEIKDNRERIKEMTGGEPSHFCYPSGVNKPDFLPWLSENGVASATTCEVGYASSACHPLLLPRVLDGSDVSPIEFADWTAGFSYFARKGIRERANANVLQPRRASSLRAS